MNANLTTGRKSEYAVSLGERDFHVTVETYPEDSGYNAWQTWVKVEEHVYPPVGSGWDRSVFPSTQICEPCNDLDAIRDAFREVWNRLRTCARSCKQYRDWAAMETGGKRGYYTKHGNYWAKQLPLRGEEWKLCKALWKEMTKL